MAFIDRLIDKVLANIATVDGIVDAIKTITDALPDAGALTTIQADLDNPDQYKADLTALEDRLSAARALLLDEITALRMAELDPGNIPGDIDTLKTYCDILDDGVNGLAAIKAEVEGLAGAAMRGTDGAATVAAGWDATLATILANFTALRIGYLDQLNFDLQEAIALQATAAKQNRVLCSVDFWSASQAEVALTGGPTSPILPAVEVAEIPDGAEIVRVIAMFKFRMIENHTVDGTNALEGATSIQVKETDTGNFTNAITFVDAQFGLAKETREGGDIIIGAIDVAAEVDANDGYSFQWTNAEAEETGIRFKDVQMGLRVWYLL